MNNPLLAGWTFDRPFAKQKKAAAFSKKAKSYLLDMCWTGEKTSKKATASDVVSQIKSFRAETGQKCLRLTKRPYLLILAKLQSNKRQKKETLRFSDQYFSYMLLSKRKIFHFNRKSRNLFTFLSLIYQSSCMKSYKIKVCLLCVTGVVERSL